MNGVASSNNIVSFEGLNEASIRALFESRSIYVDGLGTFELRGSKAAMCSL